MEYRLGKELRSICARNALDSVYEQKYSVKKNGVIIGRIIKRRSKTNLSGLEGNIDFPSFGGEILKNLKYAYSGNI